MYTCDMYMSRKCSRVLVGQSSTLDAHVGLGTPVISGFVTLVGAQLDCSVFSSAEDVSQ